MLESELESQLAIPKLSDRIQKDVRFKKIGLVITDEQHRFGVVQRSSLSSKGQNPDVLVMTATPIPRTLAFILYGDLDISTIKQLPPGRKPISTYAVNENMRNRINKFIRKNLTEGRQVYIVCPLVEESESNLRSTQKVYEETKKLFSKEFNIGIVHGKMSWNEKESIMQEFKEHKIDVLVSTSVIEVGINVPNANLIIIENAERFGLSQLHQLRGRVGRGEHQSFCILFNQAKTELSKERMQILTDTNDGFKISEKDLELRGPGDFFGTRQHGIPDFKIANLYRDINILKQVQKVANKLIHEKNNEPEMIHLRHALLDRFVQKMDNNIG